MGYSLVILSTAKKDLESFDKNTRDRILTRLEWLAVNAEQVVHHRLHAVPSELTGLCRFRVGDYRALYWKRETPPTLAVYRVHHRSNVYRRL